MEEKDKNRFDFLLREARKKKEEHDVSTALTMLLEAVENNPDNVEIINLIASCYYILGEFEKAEACWERVIELDSSNAEACSQLDGFRSPSFQFWLKRYYEALGLVECKKYDDAKSIFRKLLEENDKFVRIYQLVGLCYLACGDKKSAEKFWQKGLEMDISNTSLLNYLNGSPENKTESVLEKDMHKSRKPYVKNRIIWATAGILCAVVIVQAGIMIKTNRTSNETIQDIQNKISVLSEEIEQQKNSQPVITLSDNKDLFDDGAIKNDESIMAGSEYDTKQEGYYYEKGYNAYLNDDWKTAASNLGVVVAMQTHSYLNREALYYLARINYLNMDYKNAEKYYLKYLKEFPDSNYYDDSLFYLGCVYHFLGKGDRSVKIFQRLKELEPRSGYVHTELFQEVMGSQ